MRDLPTIEDAVHEFAIGALPDMSDEEAHILTDVIRRHAEAVRADERSRVLAGFTEETATFWDTDATSSGTLRRADPGIQKRRLVGPWQPVGGDES